MRSLPRSSLGAGIALAAGVAFAAPMAAAEPASPNDQMQAVLDQLAALGPEPIETLTPEEARQQPTVADAVTALLESQGASTAPEPVASVEDMTIPGPAGDLPVRVYAPASDEPLPIIVYYHGGGFVIATIDVYDSSARALANAADAVVVSVEYRKAPEHPFPAAVEDAYAAYLWATQHGADIGGDPVRVAVAGESAGGNLAAVVSRRARDSGDQLPAHQLLVYPVTSSSLDFPSIETYADAVPLNKPALVWFFGHYAPDPADADDPDLSPIDASDLSGLPSATLVQAEIDPLVSEGKAYADALAAAGVDVELRQYDGVTHEFFGTGAVVDEADQAVAFASHRLMDSFEELPDSSVTSADIPTGPPFAAMLALVAGALALLMVWQGSSRPGQPFRRR